MDDLDAILQSQGMESGTKKAVETLHPNDEEVKDRLSNLTPQEVSNMAVAEFFVHAVKTKDWTEGFIAEPLMNKVKALKVSMNGSGRREVSDIFRPEIQGEMMMQGMMPPQSGGMQGGGFLSPLRNMFRRRF